MKIQRFIVIILTFCLILSVVPISASAALLPSSWAETELELAQQWGLLSARSDSSPGKPVSSWGSSGYSYGYSSGLSYPESYTAGITKDAFCQLVMTMSEKLLGHAIPAADVRFSDENTPGYYYRAYEAGIISGTGIMADGAVIPDRDAQLSREQIAKMLYQAIVYCYPNEAVSSSSATSSLAAFSDAADISDWALNPAAYMTQIGILKGADGRFLPNAQCSFEQGVILAKRVFERFAANQQLNVAPILQSGLSAPVVLSPENAAASICIQDGVKLKWLEATGAARYLVKIDSPGETQTQYMYTSETEMEIIARRYKTLNPGLLSVSIAAVNGSNTIISPYARLDITLYNDPNYYFDFTSSAEAAKYMTTIKINVWDFDSSGVKVTKTMNLTVHKYIADDVIAIFDEIYNGPEQFPIHTIGGYRVGTSGEHPKGTAIDINWDENYEIYNDGRITCGTLWAPGENPYSIPLVGDVVNAFRARGWGWGGTDWSKKQDYMHFSYFGT